MAATYRLATRRGWVDSIGTCLSAAMPAEPGYGLLNMVGMRIDEVMASGMVKLKTADILTPRQTLSPDS